MLIETDKEIQGNKDQEVINSVGQLKKMIDFETYDYPIYTRNFSMHILVIKLVKVI